ncbi:uncharacterized protein PG986_002172 [Apiospora aurea]|uniref:Zn(2)-C6 fungal-type domain-containing protein n=1 Tax=Apiospora aurea TaxID=335848 RepID=A0ABR1QYX6_9PEZI
MVDPGRWPTTPESSQPPPEKRQRSHMACGNCRLKKSKCDGKRPSCTRCSKQEVECHYADEEKAMTISGLQSQVQRLTKELDEHNDFLAYLRSVPVEEANNILRQLRTSSDASQVRASVQGSLAERARPSDLRHARGLMSPTGSSIEFELTFLHGMVYPTLVPLDTKNIDIDTLLRSATRSSHRHHGPAPITTAPTDAWEGQSTLSSPWQGIPPTIVSSVSGPSQTPEYCDERLKHLNIGYWTRVPLDNVFAASAISLYLESDHPFFGIFDADLVIDSLVYQRVDFCSPFLVVALLYMACQSFTTVDIKSSSLIPALFHEAQKLHRAEGADSRPMTITATMLFGFGSTMAGRETLALDLFATARRKAVETGLFGVSQAHDVDDQWKAWRQLSSDQLRERAQVAWGAFNWLTALSRFCLITYEIYFVYHCAEGDPDASPPSLAFAETKFQSLLSWADTLPKELACGYHSPAHTYLLFCLYHGTILYILRPFLGSAATLRLQSFAAADSTPDKIFDASMNQLKRLLYIYISQLQSSLYSPILSCGMMHLNTALMKAATTRRNGNGNGNGNRDEDDADADAADEWRFYFRLSLVYLQELYKRYPMWLDVIKAMLAMAVDSGNLTSAEALRIIEAVARESGQHHLISAQVFSSCIVDFDLAITDPDRARVHELALKFDQLALFDEFTTVVADGTEAEADV